MKKSIKQQQTTLTLPNKASQQSNRYAEQFRTCPNCPKEGILEGDQFLASDYHTYEYQSGSWIQTSMEPITYQVQMPQSDNLAPSAPWINSSQEQKNSFQQYPRTQSITTPRKKEKWASNLRWKSIENVVSNPVVTYSSDEYREHYKLEKQTVTDPETGEVNSYGRKPNCFHAALYQLYLEGHTQTGPHDAYQMVVDQKLNPDLEPDVNGGEFYIREQLEQGNPVLIGMSHGQTLEANNNDLTQHFMVIVGMGYDEEKGNYFSFYDNAISPYDDLEENRLYWNKELQRYGRKSNDDYMTEVRKNKVKKAED